MLKEVITLSKSFTKEDVIQNKKSAIQALNKQLEYYINDPSGNHTKKHLTLPETLLTNVETLLN